MADEPGAKSETYTFTDEEAAWLREHLTGWRQSVSGSGLLYMSLGLAFVLGLAAHSVGYLLRVSVTTKSLGLLADLLYALGWSLWTSVVVVLFVQVIPDIKRRQIKRYLDAYEAVKGDQG